MLNARIVDSEMRKVCERATGLSLLFTVVSFWDQLAHRLCHLLDQRFIGDLFEFAVRSVSDLNKAGEAWKTE